MEDLQLKEILVNAQYVRPEDMARAEKYAAKNNTSITDLLLKEELISKQLITQAIAQSFGVPYINLHAHPPDRETILNVPEAIARKFHVVLVGEDDAGWIFASNEPTSAELSSTLKKTFPKQKFTIGYAGAEEISASFANYRTGLSTRFEQILQSGKQIGPEFLHQIFDDALLFRASDIHSEPAKEIVIIRFRVDGVLEEAGRMPKEYYEVVLNRIKVEAEMHLDEHMASQDGAIRYKPQTEESLGDQDVDLRVSILPTINGEKVVIRVLSNNVKSLTVNELSLSPADQKSITDAARKPFGMVIVVGPTGSGKTTTLYALIQMLNNTKVNITTIEDPVEYVIEGINQIQVNARTNVSFDKGLRAIVRQDPDIILVGEIRDLETAQVAVNASLTGHLLLSTFHANDTASTIPRLLDLGIPPYLLASTLEIVVSQRLLRRICEGCRYSVALSASQIAESFPGAEAYLPKKGVTVYEGRGCAQCNNSGYKGRVAIFEMLHITPEIQDIILQHPSNKQIHSLAETQGFHSLFADGIQKVLDGVTSLEELFRVASP